MVKMKKICILFISLLLVIAPSLSVLAEEQSQEKVKVYMFRGDGCGFCEKALEFFESIEEEYGKYFDLITYETFSNKENSNLMKKVAKVMNDTVTGVPYIIIGEKTYNGFDEEKMGEEIKSLIKAEYEKEPSERYDAIAEATKPVKRNIVTDIIVVGSAIAVVAGIIVLRLQNKDEDLEEEKVETKVEVKKVEKTKKEEVKKVEKTKKEEVKSKSKKEDKKEPSKKKKTK